MFHKVKPELFGFCVETPPPRSETDVHIWRSGSHSSVCSRLFTLLTTQGVNTNYARHEHMHVQMHKHMCQLWRSEMVKWIRNSVFAGPEPEPSADHQSGSDPV